MLKYLKYRTIRKTIYDSIWTPRRFHNTEVFQSPTLKKLATKRLELVDGVSTLVEGDECSKFRKNNDTTKLLSDLNNFVKIFEGYPVNDSSINHDPVKLLKLKHNSLHRLKSPKVINYTFD